MLWLFLRKHIVLTESVAVLPPVRITYCAAGFCWILADSGGGGSGAACWCGGVRSVTDLIDWLTDLKPISKLNKLTLLPPDEYNYGGGGFIPYVCLSKFRHMTKFHQHVEISSTAENSTICRENDNRENLLTAKIDRKNFFCAAQVLGYSFSHGMQQRMPDGDSRFFHPYRRITKWLQKPKPPKHKPARQRQFRPAHAARYRSHKSRRLIA